MWSCILTVVTCLVVGFELAPSPDPEADPLDKINLDFPNKQFLKDVPTIVHFDKENMDVPLETLLDGFGGGHPIGNRPYGNRPYRNPPYGNRPYGNRPYGNRPYGNRPYGNRPYRRHYGGRYGPRPQ